MSPSDKNKSTGNSSNGEGQNQLCSESCVMEFSSASTSPSTSNVTLPGHGTIINIPWVTASQATVKCSVNDQMKTFDPGEEGGIERLTCKNSENTMFLGRNSCSLIKNSNKNYKAGSKINKLADMLAKRSQNMVEVKQNNSSDKILDDNNSTPNVEEETVISNSVDNVIKNINGSLFETTENRNELKLFRKSRRKSVPSQSCSVHQWQLQATSKSCSNISELFPLEVGDASELNNALGRSMIKLQTDESTKKKVIRKNLRNVKLPLILPERKRRSSLKNDSLISVKVLEKNAEDSSVNQTENINKNKDDLNEIVGSLAQSPKPSVRCTKVKKESKVKQRKSKRLVENSTQTADLEFISLIKPNADEVNEKLSADEVDKPTITYECLYCTQTFLLASFCKAHEKTHFLRNATQFKCQFCYKKLISLEELKSHCVQKHSNKYAYCMKCDERFSTKEELYIHSQEVHVTKNEENETLISEESPKSPSQEKKQEEAEEKADKKISKNSPKSDLKIDISFESSKKSSVSPRNIQKCSPKETKTEEQLLEMEMLFYSHLSGNIQENLSNHLDGKIDKSGNPVRTDQITESPDSTKTSSTLSVDVPSAGIPDIQVSRAPSPYQTRSKTPNPLPPTAKKFKKLPNWQQKFWEKYNFPTNYRYEHRFWDKNYLNSEKSAFYLKDLSCLDIKTQLTMRENIKKLDEIKKIEENSKPADKLSFPDYLSLVPRINKITFTENKVDSQKIISECPKAKKQSSKEEIKKSFKSPGSELPVVKNLSKVSSDSSCGVKKHSVEGVKMMTRRQSSLELMRDDKEDNSKKRKGSLDLSGSQRMALRRQTSLDNLGSAPAKVDKNEQVLEANVNNVELDKTPLSPTGSAEISGEWVRPRSYLCGTCCTKFTNLWELEDHKWVSHPNVWCTHYEFEDDKIDKLFQKNEDETTEENSGESSEMSKSKLTDLYKRYLLPHGSLKTAKLVPKSNFPEQCTKCKKNCMNSSEMHKHMLDCGGDTTWFLTMYSSPMTIKRKWRPFGSRRKKQIGRRDVKRNIPSTPNIRSYHYQHRIRTKPGDVESIQKMLANLPEKRARRAINFDEIKTRSQATIHSNRLLRKRFKSSFSNNFLKLKAIKQKRQLKQGKKEGSSKSTTDTSSENTPVGSPKRRNKLKENLQLLKEENSRDGSSETSVDLNVKISKKKVQNKKKEADLTQRKNEQLKGDKQKLKKETVETVKEKPMTRSNGFVIPGESKSKRKTVVKEENLSEAGSSNVCLTDSKEQKNVPKSKKSSKKKTGKTVAKKEIPACGELNGSPDTNKARETPARVAKKTKTESENLADARNPKKGNSHWSSARCNPILRLKQNNKAKTELLKSMQKKFKNSRKILEKKEVEKAEGGSRRSLRIKSLQHVDNNSEIFDQHPVDTYKKVQSGPFEKDLKIKTVVVSLENAVVGDIVKSSSGKSLKASDQKLEKSVTVSPSVRRSLRNSVTLDDKPEIMKNDDNKILPFNPRSILRRNLRNDKNDSFSTNNTVEDSAIVKPTRFSSLANGKSLDGSPVAGSQGTLKKHRLQNLKQQRGVIKLEGPLDLKNFDSSRNHDLEEMPILAKVEPIRGKISSQNEKEIPILMPVEKERKRSSSVEEEVMEDSVSFHVIKKRRKNSKEITPLKIVKKVECIEGESSMGSSAQIDEAEVFVEDSLDFGRNKKRKSSDPSASDVVEKTFKTDAKKYFLGIDPTEIDKGRNEGLDESGSDNEPLICLINNQAESQSGELSLKKEAVESEKPAGRETLSEPESSVNLLKNKPTDVERNINEPFEKQDKKVTVLNTQTEQQLLMRKIKLNKKIKIPKKKRKTPSKPQKELRVTVTLKEPALKIIENAVENSSEGKWPSEPASETTRKNELTETPAVEDKPPAIIETVLPQRRSRRISKETKSSNEFVIDDPLILVDELWSDLDSDSDSSKRKSRKGKKKTPKKKTSEDKRISDVNLEELLRNFGENKEVKKNEEPPNCNCPTVKIVKNRTKIFRNRTEVRKVVENRRLGKSYKRLSLKLFRFNKTYKNFGNRGVKLSDAKKALQQKLDELQAKSNNLPDLPFLAAEIKENPVQVIQCRAQKTKLVKKGFKKVEPKCQNSGIHLKISLPLEVINNISGFNNNHLTEPILEETRLPAEETQQPEKEIILVETISEKENQGVEEESGPIEFQDVTDLKNKAKRSEVIDKIFYCEICKTYYYSSSQLKIHKLSNRHKLKESEFLQAQNQPPQTETQENVETESPMIESQSEVVPVVENVLQPPSGVETGEVERINEDTLEMPILEGPFIEHPLTRLATEPIQSAPPPPPVTSFGFTQESLKDIQKAIGCTDEEMLILTLLGENTIEIENDILDLDTCKSNQTKPLNQKEKVESSLKENEKANGAFTVDLKQRMTSALACLVNKAVFNLLQKYETAAKSAVNPEALSLLGKLSNLSRRKNILQLSELLKKRSDGESSIGTVSKDLEKKEPTISYKYQCTICGSRFEKASTRECHISRSHRGKAKKVAEEAQPLHTAHEDEWNDSWSYDTGDDHLGGTNVSQFWCSDCGINFLSPQEVLEHQKLEHQAALKEPEQIKESGPLQSSTIGSSDEILEGKKTRRRPKLFSSEELDQQRIIANNELRKLDRKFANKNKSSKIKWGMDALKFTVEKENKMVIEEEEKEVAPEEPLKTAVDVKNIDLVPKLNLSRISNIPEFKVIQKNSFENRFQKIIDNKLKRKCAYSSQDVNAGDEIEEELMLVPVVVKKKNKKQKSTKCYSKKEESGKPVDVYDFNESESEGEPAVYSHLKKPSPSPTKLKIVKVKEGPSKNKADSTTKDLAPDDYDSEDSLPLSVVKKSKPGEEDDEKEEKISEDGVEKSDGILEQVEYLIEQLENETGSSKKEDNAKETIFEPESRLKKNKTPELLKDDSLNSVFATNGSLRVSVANKFLELEELHLKNKKTSESDVRKSDLPLEEEGAEESPEQEGDSLLAEPESSQSTFDEEDSIPLVLISKKAEKSKFNSEEKKCDENTTDVSTTASEDVSLIRAVENKGRDARDSPVNAQTVTEESQPPVFSSSENEGAFNEKSEKPFQTLNGNVIYCRNDSMTDFESDLSSDSLIDSNFEKNNSRESDKSFIKEITEKEDVVIVCSKGPDDESNERKPAKKLRNTPVKEKENSQSLLKKKKRFPLLTATIEENNFRRSESPKSNKEVIVRKIWNRKKLTEESSDNDEDSYVSIDENNISVENTQEDESQTEIEKDIIVKKIWNRKRYELEDESVEKVEDNFTDIKINQTEVSDEVVIKCGPKAKSSPKRRKSRNLSSETSKDTIMRKIWSGRCTFQTKAALKTYDCDVLPNCKENEISESPTKSKRRGRAGGSFASTKRSKFEDENDDHDEDDDDLDSLLEEIEREQLEKAIRSEFLQLRRSEKANVEMKDSVAPTVGLFTETTLSSRKEVSEKRRRKIKKKIKHPRQSVLKRKKFIRKPFRRVLPSEEKNFKESTNRTNPEGSTEQSENSLDKNIESFEGEAKTKNRKHKKHRHKHHHHKHKHKKSKHHKSAVGKHKSKHECEEKKDEGETENADSFTILKKICQEIPSQIENESQLEPKIPETNSDVGDVDDAKVNDVFSFGDQPKEGAEVEFESEVSGKKPTETVNIYEFVEDVPDFTVEGIRNPKK